MDLGGWGVMDDLRGEGDGRSHIQNIMYEKMLWDIS